jgi:hypothetical protein
MQRSGQSPNRLNNGVKYGEQKEEKNAREVIDEVNGSQAGVE